jgi:hypothetical protein
LNALEAAEEAHVAKLESIIETPLLVVIGMDNRQRRTSTDEMDNSQEAKADTSTVFGGML